MAAHELLLINPAKRRKARRAVPAKRAAPRRKPRRRTGPLALLAASPTRRPRRATRRRRNPVSARRRRNPISMGGSGGNSVIAQLKAALIGGAGAVAMDVVMGQIGSYLPESMQRKPGKITVGDAVKATFTVLLGSLLSKPTKGLSRKLAAGALTVQTAEILRTLVPSAMTLGYASPSRIVQGSARVGPNRQLMAAYQNGRTPLLNGYAQVSSPLLNGAGGRSMGESARVREGVSLFR